MPFVLDAVVAASWCFADEHDPRADAAYERLYDDSAIVPLQWWFEVRNVVLHGERRQRISQDITRGFLDRLGRLAIELEGPPDQTSVLTLARRHRLTFYDAAYLELALREHLALATLDDALAAAARAEGVALIGAAS